MANSQNRFAVMRDGRIAELVDGTLCFSRSRTSARRDMAAYVRWWRSGKRRTAVKNIRTSTEDVSYDLKLDGAMVGVLRIEEVSA